MIHKPVLLNEVIEILSPKKGDIFVDGTANGGGHTLAIWEKIKPSGKIIAIDKDKEATKSLQKKAKRKNIKIVCASYADLKNIIDKQDFGNISGILLDLGYSSFHIEKSKRGFSFQKDEPLIMRYDANKDELSAYDVINSMPEKELADIIYKYGEEKNSRKIAKKIVQKRKEKKIETSLELAEIIKSAFSKKRYKIHPATKTFQALRIFVNDELGELERFLPQVVDVLKKKGKLAVISFHSLEDRIVKRFLKEKKDVFKILTKKPITPSKEEIIKNPRSRSAKLRVAEKI